MNVRQALLIAVLFKTELVVQWNVWTLKHVKTIHLIIKSILIVQKVFVWMLVRHNIHYQNIHNLNKDVLNVVIVIDSIKSMNKRLLLDLELRIITIV